jgi:F0F1-type ATP synthase assembly protein I
VLGVIGLLATLTQAPTGNSRVVGVVVGVVAGVGIGLLLQQMAILDPANLLGLLLPGGGAVLGLILPLRSRSAGATQG